jgi:hypothetical protein
LRQVSYSIRRDNPSSSIIELIIHRRSSSRAAGTRGTISPAGGAKGPGAVMRRGLDDVVLNGGMKLMPSNGISSTNDRGSIVPR